MKVAERKNRLVPRAFVTIVVLSVGLLWAGLAFGQSTDSFTYTGALNNARDYQTATSLQSGLVLIAGGFNGSSYLSSAELYNPSTGTFSTTGSMTTARNHHTATLLNDGTVLITGGFNGTSYLNTAEIYDPSTGTFAAAAGNMLKERAFHTATLLTNGTVLIDGGCNGGDGYPCTGGFLNTAEIYNPSTGTFSYTTGNMQKERAYQTATALIGGAVLIAGGCNGGGSGSPCSSGFLNTAEIYNPSTETFSYTTGGMVNARAEHTATLLSNGTVLVAGGDNTSTSQLNTAELYSPSSGSFTATGNMTTARARSTGTLLGDGTVLIAGGYNGTDLSSAEIYTPSAGSFAATNSMNTARDNLTAVRLSNGTVLAAGGYDDGTYLSSAEIFSNLLVGYVDPKFLVVAVTYAPPGPSQNTWVSYTNSTFVGTTNSLSNSFMNGDTYSVALTSGISIPLVGSGKITDTYGTSINQTTKSTSSVTMSFQTSTGEKTFGTGSYWSPVDNDYDIIWVWLNPALIFSLSSSGSVTWNGYGIDKTDQSGMDVVPIALGYLNGDFGTMPPDIQTSLNRSWASGFLPTGQNPALTSADLAQIASADPFSVSKYGPDEIGPNPPSPTTPDYRFTMSTCTDVSSFNYVQADPSQSPNIFTCTLTYTNTSVQSQDITSTYSESFSVDDAFSGSGFLSDFSADVKSSNTITWTSEEQSTITRSSTSTASLSVQGPPCNNVNQGVGPCVPIYDSEGNEPVQFYVYQDNVYGTFMFAPVDYYQ